MAEIRLADAIGRGIGTIAQLQSIENNNARSLREAEAFEMDKQAYQDDRQFREEQRQQNQQMHNIRMQQLSKEEQERAQALLAKKLYAMDAGGGFTDEERQEYLGLTRGSRLADPDYISRPEVGEALEIYPKIISGEISRDDPAAIKAYNTLLNVQRGATDGRQVSVNKILPSKSGNGIYIGLDVTNKDGTKNAGVLTDRRSADKDDPVSEISFDELNEVYGNARNLRALVTNPKFRQAFYREHGFGTQPVSAKDQSMIDKNNALANLYKTRAETERKNPKSGGSKETAQERNIALFKSMGYDDKQAVDLVVNRGADPVSAITGMAKTMMGDPENPAMPWEEAMARAQKYYQENFSIMPGGDKKPEKPSADSLSGGIKQAPQAALDYLKQNPDQAENFKAKYGYLPE